MILLTMDILIIKIETKLFFMHGKNIEAAMNLGIKKINLKQSQDFEIELEKLGVGI